MQGVFANEPWSQDRKWLLGDWNGERQALEKQGYKFNVAFVNETATNFAGGYGDTHHVKNASQLTFGANFDLNKIWGWDDTQASLAITKRDGHSLRAEYISDPRVTALSSEQEVFGRGPIWRLTQMWVKKGFNDNKLQVKFGRMGLSEDFNGSQSEFQNGILSGAQIGKTNNNVWFNAPVSQWGLNAKYQFAPEFWLGLGVYEANADNTRLSQGFNLDMDGMKGVVVPVELTWKPKTTLAGEYKIGAYYTNTPVKEVASTEINRDKHSYWVNAQQQLTTHHGDAKRGLFGTVNLVFNDSSTNSVKNTQQVAVWYKGLFDARPNDSMGLAVGHYHVNKSLRASQNAKNENKGLTTADYNNPAYTPVQHDEWDAEINYTYNWSPSISLRPNVQYVHNVGGVKQIDDAWSAGLTMRVNF